MPKRAAKKRICAKVDTTCKKSTLVRVMYTQRGHAWLNEHAHYTEAEKKRKPLSERTKKSKANRIGHRKSKKAILRLLHLKA